MLVVPMIVMRVICSIGARSPPLRRLRLGGRSLNAAMQALVVANLLAIAMTEGGRAGPQPQDRAGLLEQAVLLADDDHHRSDSRWRDIPELGDRDGGHDVGFGVLQDFLSLAEIETSRNGLDFRQFVADDLELGNDLQRPVRSRGDVAAGPPWSGLRRGICFVAAGKGRSCQQDADQKRSAGCGRAQEPLPDQECVPRHVEPASCNTVRHRMLKLTGTVISAPARSGGGGGNGCARCTRASVS